MDKDKEELRLLKNALEIFEVNDKNYQDVGYCFGDIIPNPDKLNELLKQIYEVIIVK